MHSIFRVLAIIWLRHTKSLRELNCNTITEVIRRITRLFLFFLDAVYISQLGLNIMVFTRQILRIKWEDIAENPRHSIVVIVSEPDRPDWISLSTGFSIVWTIDWPLIGQDQRNGIARSNLKSDNCQRTEYSNLNDDLSTLTLITFRKW